MEKHYEFKLSDIALIEKAIAFHELTKNAFFWNPSNYASGRRNHEKKMYEKLVENAKIEYIEYFNYENKKTKSIMHILTIQQEYSESCKNVYRNSNFYIDGIKTTVRKIKGLIK